MCHYQECCYHTHTHARTHTHLTARFLELPGWAGTRKVKPIWILLKQETVSGSGISWTICKSARCSRQITTPAPHHSVVSSCCYHHRYLLATEPYPFAGAVLPATVPYQFAGAVLEVVSSPLPPPYL